MASRLKQRSISDVLRAHRRDSSRMPWFGTYAAVIGYDGESFTIIDNESLGLVPSKTSDAGGVHIRCVFEDSKGNLWIGNNGIGVILHDGDTAINFTEEHGLGKRDASDESASLHRVFSIGEDRAGNIWFGTAAQGAWRYDGKSLRNFTAEDGLTSKGVMAIYKDTHGGGQDARPVEQLSRAGGKAESGDSARAAVLHQGRWFLPRYR